MTRVLAGCGVEAGRVSRRWQEVWVGVTKKTAQYRTIQSDAKTGFNVLWPGRDQAALSKPDNAYYVKRFKVFVKLNMAR